MSEDSNAISELVAEMRQATAQFDDPGLLVNALRDKVRDTALKTDWREESLYLCDSEQGFGVHTLHQEPDHSLAVIAVSWLPGRGAPPHNHGTWAIVAGVEGPEKNVYWKRLDDGSRPGHAELHRMGDQEVCPGDAIVMLDEHIHSVTNESDAVTLSLHVYGMHPNHTGRSQFDPEAETESVFVVKEASN